MHLKHIFKILSKKECRIHKYSIYLLRTQHRSDRDFDPKESHPSVNLTKNMDNAEYPVAR